MDPAREKKQEMPVGEDAAAAARRIVEEVLARRGGPQEGPSGTAGTPDTGRDPVAAEAAAADDVATADDVTESVASTSPEPAAGPGSARPEAPAGRPEEVSEAQRIARRIVDEVLADEAEVTVRGVPRDGLPVEGERTAKIEVDPHPPGETTQRVPGGSGAAAPPGAASRQSGAVGADGLPAGPVEDHADAEAPSGRAGRARGPSPDPDSADEIVRRIVADVQAEDPPGTAELPVGMTHDSGDPGAAIAEDDGTTRVVPRTGKKREAPSESTSGPLALTDDGEPAPTRPLVGWAPPPEPEPTGAAEVPEDPAPRALRWLLASLVGAVALAVLFPLAVAALRALVSLG